MTFQTEAAFGSREVGEWDGTGFGGGDVVAEGDYRGGLEAVEFCLRNFFWTNEAIVVGLSV